MRTYGKIRVEECQIIPICESSEVTEGELYVDPAQLAEECERQIDLITKGDDGQPLDDMEEEKLLVYAAALEIAEKAASAAAQDFEKDGFEMVIAPELEYSSSDDDDQTEEQINVKYVQIAT